MAIPVLSTATTKAEIIKCIQQLVPPRVPEPQDPQVIMLLKNLTTELIQAYAAEGCLQEDPFAETRERRIYLYKQEIIKKLEGKVVLITGGEGCVGSHLLKELIELGAQRVVSVDKTRCHESLPDKLISKQQPFVVLYPVDIRDYNALKLIFEIEKPDIVFHLAAQRQPGLAEIQIRETITTNVFGTQNVIQLCEKYGVQQCIFSSTGKASRYFTSDVYAGSKKIAEWQFAQAAQQGSVQYRMVRFTHIIENSIVSQKIEQGIKHGIVKLHAPNLYMFAQNVSEAVTLLLNALVISNSKHLNFLVVRNLGWVVDVIELALFKILTSKNIIPLYFEGIFPGYDEPCFQGQLDPSCKTVVNPLINILESPISNLDSYNDILCANVSTFDYSILNKNLLVLNDYIKDHSFPEKKLKEILVSVTKEGVHSIFLNSPPEKILRILKLGVNQKMMEVEGTSIDAYKDVIELLVKGLYGRLKKEFFINSKISFNDFNALIKVLATLPTICNEVAYLQDISQQLSH